MHWLPLYFNIGKRIEMTSLNGSKAQYLEERFTRLSAIPSGGRCLVHSVQIDGVMRRRLMDLGLVPDAQLVVLRRAPLMDPIEVQVGNAYVALRRDEAERIEVIKL